MLKHRTAIALVLLGLAGLAVVGMPSLAQDATVAATAQIAANRAILDRYVEAFNRHDPDGFAAIIATDYIQHNGRAGPGLAGLQSALVGYFRTFPDFHMTVEDSIISGDRIVARLTLSATHSQPVQLAPNAPVFPPTGRKLVWGGIDIWRVEADKLVEHWDQADLAGLSRQLRPQ
jgi:predicted ester cyclase